MIGKNIYELKVGDIAQFSKTIIESDVYLYAGLTGDLNPQHINEIEAKDSIFKKRIAHGMLTAGLVSAVIGMQLPGPGTIYLAQDMEFTKPVYFNDTITARVEVIEIIKEKIVKLKTICLNQNGEIVLNGEATVMPPHKK